ncbi:helix-turn-helix domain-containing protein [Streptomyces sp. NPDC093225]|uniref:helix-turn-helix domain-containing protein n=1 Tax=Streptomyces sp. NPDC093225 TaxID=3366034 RepID=UPI00381ECF54
MRRIKRVSRLTYSQLAERAHYSRSSWERFLNGKTTATPAVVREFAKAVGSDPVPLLALLDRPGPPPRATAAPFRVVRSPGGRSPVRRRNTLLAVVFIAGVAVGDLLT